MEVESAADRNRELLARPNPDELSMLLYPHEIDKAQQIKKAVKRQSEIGDDSDIHSGLKPLSDYEYVQYAICTEGETIDQIVQRVTMMQAFREEYNINDTVEEFADLLEQVQDIQPGWLLTVDYLPDTQNFCYALAWSCLFPGRYKTHKHFRIHFGSMYYIHQVLFSNFCAIRQGYVAIGECTDCTLVNCDFGFFDKFNQEIFRWYPSHAKEMVLMNSPGCVNIVMALCQKFLTPNTKNSISFGVQIQGMEGQRIDPLYQSPTPEIARQNMMTRVKSFLSERYKHERQFTLPPQPGSMPHAINDNNIDNDQMELDEDTTMDTMQLAT